MDEVTWTVPGTHEFDPPLDICAGDEIVMWVNPETHEVQVHNLTTDLWYLT